MCMLIVHLTVVHERVRTSTHQEPRHTAHAPVNQSILPAGEEMRFVIRHIDN